MKNAKTISNAITNIRYYAGIIRKASKEQFELDTEIKDDKGFVNEPSGIRFNCIACINQAGVLMDIYCDNIESNLKHAVEQDYKFTEVYDGSQSE